METVLNLLIIYSSLISLLVFLYVFPINLWLNAIFSGIWTTPGKLMAMRIKRIPPRLIIECAINSKNAGVYYSLETLCAHYLAGGHVPSVIKALIAAKNNNLKLTFEEAAQIDLGGTDVFLVVMTTVNPQKSNCHCFINLPSRESTLFLDFGIQIKFKKIAVKNLSIINRIEHRVLETAFNSVFSFEINSLLKNQTPGFVQNIRDQIRIDDLELDILEFGLENLTEISDKSFLELNLAKNHQKFRYGNTDKIKVGDGGFAVWDSNKPESATANINDEICTVFYSKKKLTNGTQIVVKEINQEGVYVDLYEEKE